MADGCLSSRRAACVMAVAIFVCGCGPQSAVQTEVVAEPKVSTWQTPNEIDVINATVGGIYDHPITLLAGEYEGTPFIEGAAMRPRVHLIREMMPVGDLTGDGVDERLALFEENSGGTGHFLHIVPFAMVDGRLVQLGHALVGDRIKIRSVVIEDGLIVMRTIQAGPDDGACCPTEKNRRVWALQESRLIETETEVEGTLSLVDFAGSEWVLTAFDIGDPTTSAAEVTLQFDLEENKIFGTSGCNRYFGTVESSAPRQIAIGPLAGTKRMCPPELMEIEARFLRALESANSYTYFLGKLAIGFTAGDKYGTMLFADTSDAPDETGELEGGSKAVPTVPGG